MIRALLTPLGVLALAAAGIAQPIVNDTCATALPISGGQQTVSTIGASSSGVSNSCFPASPDAWFFYTPTCDGIVSGSLSPNSGFALLAFYDSCSGSLIECTTAANPSFLFSVTAGQQFRVQVAQIVVGTHELVLNCFAPGNCGLAGELDLGPNPVTTDNASDSGVAASCFAMGPDSWYVYTAIYDGLLDIEMVNGSSADKRFAIFDDCGTLNELFCTNAINPSALFPVIAGEDYYFKIRDFGSGNSNLVLTADVPDECIAANLISDGSNLVSTRSATTSPVTPASCFSNAVDTYYQYVATCSGDVSMTISNLGVADNVLAVYTGCSLSTEIVCDSSVGASVSFSCSAGDVFNVRVRAFSVGESNLIVSCTPSGASFIRGDMTEDGMFSLPDAIALLSFLFSGATGPSCQDTADINADGQLTLPDAVYFLTFLFSGGPAPSAPYPSCGTAPAGSPTVGCVTSSSNCP